LYRTTNVKNYGSSSGAIDLNPRSHDKTSSGTVGKQNTTSAQMTICTESNGCVIAQSISQANTDNNNKIGQNAEAKIMHIQLMGPGEASVDDTRTAVNRWREYVDSYVTEHPTEWTQGINVGVGHGQQPRLFVRR
jgi:histone deacetylase complex regulatory component SIN3